MDKCIEIINYVTNTQIDIENFIGKKIKASCAKLNGTKFFHPFIVLFEHFFGN